MEFYFDETFFIHDKMRACNWKKIASCRLVYTVLMAGAKKKAVSNRGILKREIEIPLSSDYFSGKII